MATGGIASGTACWLEAFPGLALGAQDGQRAHECTLEDDRGDHSATPFGHKTKERVGNDP